MKKRGHTTLVLARHLRTAGFVGLGLLAVVGMAFPSLRDGVVQAATCATIADCQQQIANDKNTVADLQNDATSYQDAISKLQSQIGSIQQEIAISQAQQVQLEGQIADAQAQLIQQKQVLATDVKMQYVSGGISTAEMLASSQDLSAFADSETYRSAVQSKLQDTLDQITTLETKLQNEKADVDQQLADQTVEHSQLASAKRQQQSMLSYDAAQQASYTAQVAQNQQKLNALIAAQLAANNRFTASYYFLRFPGAGRRDPLTGSYPYADSGFSMSTAPGCVNNDGPDQWGYCDRQCVSYAAWAVQFSGGKAPIGWGSAKNWVSVARRSGIPVYPTPQPGDIAISTSGAWGHAMYVEQVKGKQIYVSQYNQQLTGRFSTQWRAWQ